MWTPIHSSELENAPKKFRGHGLVIYCDGWYIWHPEHGLRLNHVLFAGHVPYRTREDAQAQCDLRETIKRCALRDLETYKR